MEQTLPTLPPPSPNLQKLLDEEQLNPDYVGMDEGERAIAALRAVHQKHGDGIFDFTNVTDDLLRQTLTGEAL